MYLAAREWGIQPSEFWDMTFVEWLLEANFRWENSEEGQLEKKKEVWREDLSLTEEEWMKKYGFR